MRDHRAFCNALRARHIRRAGRLPTVATVFAAMATPHFTVARRYCQHKTHQLLVNVAPVVNHRHSVTERILVRTTELAPSPSVRPASRRTRVVMQDAPVRRPVPTASSSPAISPIPRRAVTRRVAPAPTQHLVVAPPQHLVVAPPRREVRVSPIARVVPGASPTHPRAQEHQPHHIPALETPLPSPGPQRPPSTTGPSPTELASITRHVLTAIDNRLIAHNERLGRR